MQLVKKHGAFKNKYIIFLKRCGGMRGRVRGGNGLISVREVFYFSRLLYSIVVPIQMLVAGEAGKGERLFGTVRRTLIW